MDGGTDDAILQRKRELRAPHFGMASEGAIAKSHFGRLTKNLQDSDRKHALHRQRQRGQECLLHNHVALLHSSTLVLPFGSKAHDTTWKDVVGKKKVKIIGRQIRHSRTTRD